MIKSLGVKGDYLMGGGSGSGINTVALIAIISGIVVVLIGVILFLAAYRNKAKKEVEVKTDYIDNNMWVNALGGNENIEALEAKGSRLIVKVKNNELVKKDDLHKLGVVSLISSQDKITLVLKEKAENIKNLLQ